MTTNLPLISINIVSYNTAQMTAEAMLSVIADIKRTKIIRDKAQIVIIDNASSDHSTELFKHFAKLNHIPIYLITNNNNTGFAGAHNQALKKYPAQYNLLLNSDTIIKPGCIREILKAFYKNPDDFTTAFGSAKLLDRLGIVAATLLNKNGSIQPQGGSKPSLLSLASQMFFLDDLPIIGKLLPSIQHTGKNTRQKLNAKKLFPMDWVGGTAICIRQEVINEIGFLDDEIFMYGEDIEYCMRAKNHHFDIAITPRAQVIHLNNGTNSPSGNAIVGEFKGLIYIWSKHFSPNQLQTAKFILKSGAMLRIFLYKYILKNQLKANIYQKIIDQVLS